MVNNVVTRDVARELARRYRTLTPEELDTMERLLVPMRYSKGDIILKEGDTCKYIYFISKGLVRQFYFKNGREVTEYLTYENNIVMCIESLFKQQPTRLQIEALETTILYGLPRVELEQASVKNVNIEILYRKILEESLIISQIHADLVRFETAQERYRRLMQLQPELFLRAPLVYIASYLQMTPETLSRVRAAAVDARNGEDE
ncbi:MAG: Crp/Fnr family transcriptional regulator [Bacteroidaceae bacterium]|jgi:CRP-like cAMP-binding protein|nr:Crp/Fnr family transcriptional regulator [Bacteroidaceae bacterium]